MNSSSTRRSITQTTVAEFSPAASRSGKIRVEWLNAAAPGVDSQWEMQLYGLVRTGKREKAIQFLQETRRIAPQ